ncbi:hypothetical protein [Coleofasciculus sp. F4-SAH-05]
MATDERAGVRRGGGAEGAEGAEGAGGAGGAGEGGVNEGQRMKLASRLRE